MATIITWPDGWDLEVDTTLKRSHGRKATITRHKIEDGSTVGDHVVTENNTFSMEGIISQFTFDEKDDSTLKRDLAFERIEQAYSEKMLLQIFSKNKSYENMILTGYTFPEEASQGNALFFSLEFEELRFAVSETIKMSKVPKSAIKKTNPKLTTAKRTKETDKLRQKTSEKTSKGKVNTKQVNVLSGKGLR